ncbi:kinase-like protein [Pluteus cervinus]|uniref:Kinase-like protein n=1 Tax=Pluteus cervinus TaxID=181527 RepID=A0ACD3ADI4_9AGAR|nr:kinase-like protein [Pluteus cervinus]
MSSEPTYYTPAFLWRNWLSNRYAASVDLPSKFHAYDVYQGVLAEIQQPAARSSIFAGFTLNSDESDLDLGAAETAFQTLEREVEWIMTPLINRLLADRLPSKKIPIGPTSAETLRKYFSFLRFRNSARYHEIVSSVNAHCPNSGRLYTAHKPLVSKAHRPYILQAFLSFLRHSRIHVSLIHTPSRSSPDPSLNGFHQVMEKYCWKFFDSSLCFGVASEAQQFVFSDRWYGCVETSQDESGHVDFFFPILPNAALYFLGNDVEEGSPSTNSICPSKDYIEVFAESQVDVLLRNAFILHSYPPHIYFCCPSGLSLSVLAYDGLKFNRDHQDFSQLKQLCLRKYLQETVTKTLTFKGSITLADLTEEVKLMGNGAVAYGSFSAVWKGEWYDPVERRSRVVALKFFRQIFGDKARERLLKRLQDEVIAWHNLCHRNVNPLFGIFQSVEGIALVSPWCQNGTLVEYARSKAPTSALLDLLIQAASGVAYLHSFDPVVVHGDLKGGNILVDDQGQAVISDFGLSKVMETLPDSKRADGSDSFFTGATRWLAPEIVLALVEDEIELPPITASSDVYAFASVCLEIATGQVPYPHRSNDHAVTVDILRGIRPRRSDVCRVVVRDVGAFWTMLEHCWNVSPEHRPTMAEFHKFLVSLRP